MAQPIYGDPEQQQRTSQNALQQAMGVLKPPAGSAGLPRTGGNTTQPVGIDRFKPQALQNHYDTGSAAGQDMSWMFEQNLLPRNHAQPVGPPQGLLADPATQAAPAASAGGSRGWNNLNLQAPPQQNPYEFRGFNTERAGAGGDPNSVKDGFYRFASGQQGPQDTSKEGLDAWLTALIPQAREYGLDIQDVNGDQMLVNTAENGPVWVDYFQNAGGENGGFQWLDQSQMGDVAAPAGGGDLAVPGGLQPGSDLFAALMGGGGVQDSETIKRILDEIRALEGGNSPLAQDAFSQVMR